MRFVKVEGAGNDYVLVDLFDQRVEQPEALARAISDRHRGIGSDGLLLVGPGVRGAPARMRIFNADGSEGLMCGNGLRCVVRYLIESGRVPGPEVLVETASGVRRGRLLGRALVELEMGVPDFRPQALPVRLPAREGLPAELELPAGLAADPGVGYCVSIGNPHVVVRVADPDAVDAPRFGPAIEHSELLEQGANVHFVSREGDDVLAARTWERGSGLTQACGTGAVAAAAVARRLGWVASEAVRVRMPGGELLVRWDGRHDAWLAGPAHLPFRGEWSGS